ncbi:hypothetical protein OH717_08135 [Streptomyces albidoflavus]|nr:hypothetical protein OH717_08135 [Streptomyces albidoflavus]
MPEVHELAALHDEVAVAALLAVDTARGGAVLAEEHLDVDVPAHQPVPLEHCPAARGEKQLEEIPVVRGQLARVEENGGIRPGLAPHPCQPRVGRLRTVRSRQQFPVEGDFGPQRYLDELPLVVSGPHGPDGSEHRLPHRLGRDLGAVPVLQAGGFTGGGGGDSQHRFHGGAPVLGSVMRWIGGAAAGA